MEQIFEERGAKGSMDRDNEYILSGYRAISKSYQQSLRSILGIHNETVNIFSHLIGSVLFFALPIPVYYSLQPRYDTAATADVVVFSTFFFGVAICFALSATFHVVNNHSESVHVFGNQLDYLGIVILMWGSTIPCVYYGFYCTPQLQTTYYTLVSVLAGGCVYATLHPAFRRPKYRPYRAAMYAGLGLSFIIPIMHGLLKFGWETQMWRMSLDWMALMTTFNLTGGALYAMRIPEKWYPYRFDVWGSSHQIMHCLVVCAGVAHLFGLLRAFDHVHGHGNICAA
ncbi:hemolysin-III related-domain-containing protein [Alternaria rosae]|uniref:hemolysin-III related-domain-containing protein n=1 Tax=Alternaria rosae TaxID=1187941 RepID=UPI001E8E2299|nr:hemolysin-III related-domain-containing protein [Alternaria rosae]KAH6851497.1 hemolysin-III related-domain-containing protein [Alternaria rosae]